MRLALPRAASFHRTNSLLQVYPYTLTPLQYAHRFTALIGPAYATGGPSRSLAVIALSASRRDRLMSMERANGLSRRVSGRMAFSVSSETHLTLHAQLDLNIQVDAVRGAASVQVQSELIGPLNA